MITGTVTAAAERMCISQPAVSRLLTLLEDRTGLTLFIRAKQRLQPTPEAQQFFREVERSYIGLDKLEKSVLNIRNAMTGTLRIASVPITGMAFLPRVIARYRCAHPDVTISLQTRSSTTVVDWVSSTNYDIGFAAGAPDQPNLQTITFADVKGVCVLPPSHRLAARAFVEASDLDGEEFISLDPMDRNRAAVDRLCENANIRRRLTLEAPYAAVVAAMVAQVSGFRSEPLAILDLGPDRSVCQTLCARDPVQVLAGLSKGPRPFARRPELPRGDPGTVRPAVRTGWAALSGMTSARTESSCLSLIN